VGGLRDDITGSVAEYFGALRPWVAVLVLLAYVPPLLAVIAYGRALLARDSMLVWLGTGSYALLCLVGVGSVWFAHASVFAATRFDRVRAGALVKGADRGAFVRRSRELFIVNSVLLSLFIVFLYFVDWS
jgi:hypothetical protein